MRRLLLIVLVLLLSVPAALAHPGRTDSNGGHWNHSTGEYHYHHGYPEHQHPDGVCPYAKPAATPTPKPSTPKPSYRVSTTTLPTTTSKPIAIPAIYVTPQPHSDSGFHLPTFSDLPVIGPIFFIVGCFVIAVAPFVISDHRRQKRKALSKPRPPLPPTTPSEVDQSRVLQSLIDDLARMDSQEFYRKDSGRR